MSDKPANPTPGWQTLVTQILQRRGSDTKFAATLRRGISKHTQSYAYANVLPYCREERVDETALLRACAIIAKHPDVPQTSYKDAENCQTQNRTKKFGRSCYELSHALAKKNSEEFILNPDKPDRVAQILTSMPRQSLENAARSIDSLLTLADSTNVSFDYYQITRMLLFWGQRTSPRSHRHRGEPLADYFRASSYPKKLDEHVTVSNQAN